MMIIVTTTIIMIIINIYICNNIYIIQYIYGYILHILLTYTHPLFYCFGTPAGGHELPPSAIGSRELISMKTWSNCCRKFSTRKPHFVAPWRRQNVLLFQKPRWWRTVATTVEATLLKSNGCWGDGLMHGQWKWFFIQEELPVLTQGLVGNCPILGI